MKENKNGVRLPVWIVAIIIVSVILILLERRRVHDNGTVTPVTEVAIVQSSKPIRQSVFETNSSPSDIAPETIAALERAGLYGVKVSKLTTSVHPRQSVIIPNPLLQQKNP